MKIAPSVLAALAVILALVLVDTCARRDERQKLEARQRDTRDDSTAARLQFVSDSAQQVYGRLRDSTGRVIANLRSRVARQTSPVATASGGVNSPAVVPTPDVRDTLIASLLSGRQQDSLQILFWRAHADTLRTVVASLRTARDSWRERAERPRHTLTDIAGASLTTYGLMKENELAAAAGGALILVPRVADLIGRIF